MAPTCEGYSYALAAEDVVPIVMFGVGFYYVGRRIIASIPQARSAVLAAAIVLVAGFALAGPIRKTFIAAWPENCEELSWMQLPAFTVLPAAFAALAWAMLSVAVGRTVPWWPFATAVVVIFGGAVLAGDTIVLLSGGGLMAVFFGLTAGYVAWQQHDRLTSVLYVLYCAGTLALPALGSSEDRSAVANQWIEQLTNTVTLTIFAVAGFRLLRAYQRAGDRSVLVEN